MIYSGERYGKSNKQRERHVGSLEETSCQLPRVLPQQSQKLPRSPQQGAKITLVRLSTRETLRAQHPGFLLEAGHTGSLCLVHTHPRLPAGRQVFSINHSSCIISLGTVSLYAICGNGGDLPAIQAPRCQSRANHVAGPFKGEQSGCCFPTIFAKGQMIWKISSVIVVQTLPWAIQMSDLFALTEADSGLAESHRTLAFKFSVTSPNLRAVVPNKDSHRVCELSSCITKKFNTPTSDWVAWTNQDPVLLCFRLEFRVGPIVILIY